jgi:hypothetical protein
VVTVARWGHLRVRIPAALLQAHLDQALRAAEGVVYDDGQRAVSITHAHAGLTRGGLLLRGGWAVKQHLSALQRLPGGRMAAAVTSGAWLPAPSCPLVERKRGAILCTH